MKFEIWKSQEFLKNIPKEERAIEVLKVVHNYLDYRNIEQSDKQKSDIVQFILSEILNMVYLKAHTIEWGLKEYSDTNNNSISAAIILAIIKKAYSSLQHKEILEQWEKEDEKNRLSPMTDAQKEDLNRNSRKEDFEKCVEQVKNDNVNFDKLYWVNAIQYLIKDKGLSLTPDQLAMYQEKAINIVMEGLKKDLSNVNVRREDRARATILISDLLNRKINDNDLKAKIQVTRQKLVARDYIYANYVDPSFNSFLRKIDQGIIV
jgi:hypothetical protein